MGDLTITKFIFDQYWVGANIDRIEGLMTHELEALIEYHWSLLLIEKARCEAMEEDKNFPKLSFQNYKEE